MVKLGLCEFADNGHNVQGLAKIFEWEHGSYFGVAVRRAPASHLQK
jgi:hypothetical protein